MGSEIIYLENKRNGRTIPYYYYESFDSWEEAHKVATHKKKKTKTKYFIQEREEGFLFPARTFRLYFNKVRKLTWT